jgi:UDP:flavonoid glycosyltransferase YjiC (YdhE family)
MTSKHIVLTTWGSLGDLHPILAVALELHRRGHRVTVATDKLYQAKIEETGLGFHAIRPELPQGDEAKKMVERVMDLRDGTRFLFEEMLGPFWRQNYEDLSVIAHDADLWVTHPVTMAAPLVAQKMKLRWVSTVLSPLSMFSAYDPPVPPMYPQMAALYRLGKPFTRLLFRLMQGRTRSWGAPIDALRREIGLPPAAHPLFAGQFSPQSNLAMFSSALGEPQPDWPQNTVQTGFAFYDRKGSLPLFNAASIVPSSTTTEENDDKLSVQLTRFLEAGDAPIVFTLGSAAVMNPANFYRESAQAAAILGRRALLLGDVQGAQSSTRWSQKSAVASFDYAPYSQVFSRACALVHQGGVGTTAQAMRAGKPQLIVPHSHDQPDNAARIARRGIGRTMPLRQYKAQRVAEELRPLLEQNKYSKRAAQTGAQVQSENGASKAADALEAQL